MWLTRRARDYGAALLRPENRLELGAYVAVLSMMADRQLLHPEPVDTKLQAAADRQGAAYAYVAVVAGVLNPIWIYGAYSLFAQWATERLGVPPSERAFADRIKQFEAWCISFVGDKEDYVHEFARGLVTSTVHNATLPLSVGQLLSAAVS